LKHNSTGDRSFGLHIANSSHADGDGGGKLEGFVDFGCELNPGEASGATLGTQRIVQSFHIEVAELRLHRSQLSPTRLLSRSDFTDAFCRSNELNH
jgi:hypothetical protein